MYLDFYRLQEKPFHVTPDPRFFFFGTKYQQALASLQYGIKEKKGFIMISGEVGCGKTTLCRLLLQELHKDSRIEVAIVLNTFLSEKELLAAINQDFLIPPAGTTRGALLQSLNEFLLNKKKEGKNVVLFIDEAQNLKCSVLEQIRMLSNLETDTDKLIQIILVGQPELVTKLQLPQLRQLEQRIAVRYHLSPLDLAETTAYIEHRLKKAGAITSQLFSAGAYARIHQASGGIPRRINLICDYTLMVGFVKEMHRPDESVVEAALVEMSHPDNSKIARQSVEEPALVSR